MRRQGVGIGAILTRSHWNLCCPLTAPWSYKGTATNMETLSTAHDFGAKAAKSHLMLQAGIKKYEGDTELLWAFSLGLRMQQAVNVEKAIKRGLKDAVTKD